MAEPNPVHAEHVRRALQAGKHVLCELPLAATMDDARRIVDAAAASDRQVFVDMFGRFDPATEFLHAAIAEGRYGTLKTLTIELRSALLWEGYQIGLDSIAMDVLHSSLDTIVAALGRPESMTAMGMAKDTASAAAEVLLGYPGAVVRCSASALLPKPYGMRGGYRATFTDPAGGDPAAVSPRRRPAARMPRSSWPQPACRAKAVRPAGGLWREPASELGDAPRVHQVSIELSER